MTGIQTYACPSRRDSTAEMIVAEDAQASYLSGGWKWAKTDYAGNLGCMPGGDHVFPTSPRSFSKVRDGLSTTILLGEKSFNTLRQGTGGWWWDEPYFFGGSGGSARWKAEVNMDGPDADEVGAWGSSHSAGVNFGTADGAVTSMSFQVDNEVLASMLTIDASDTVSSRE